MIVSCTGCHGRFRIDPSRIPAQGARIRCPKCKGIIAVDPTGQEPAGAVASRDADGGTRAIRVVVAHGSAAFGQTLAGFLRREGFAVEVAADGPAALALIRELRPQVVLVDVALPGVVGHALCGQVRSDPDIAGTRVILIGAIYDRTRFRRPPQSLYGADDYVEKHRIPDDLGDKIRRLVGEEPAGAGTAAPAGDATAAGAGEESGRRGPAPRTPDGGRDQAAGGGRLGAASAAHGAGSAAAGDDQARRLARIIVSDIVLYNPDAVRRGLVEGNLAELVKDELGEGRELLRARIGPAAAARDYILEALEEYVKRALASRRAAGAPR